MEERYNTPKETYHINLLVRPLNNQGQPYEWQLENPELIQKSPNEEEEPESNTENQYSYIYLPYITFEDIYGDEAQEISCEYKYLFHLPEASFNNIQFLELFNEY
ncbi:hypothetical protein O181_013935 [Austropuccinia psidii MF-1]|uniref:Uncharacterized protein n=1 Tax=Austropuccinia psidii MF-1 TaxID=1389203 RepID=A0A9Q3GPF5_9BASI|nr:hypothetical protein [Austropuccinia psidii MF-1]